MTVIGNILNNREKLVASPATVNEAAEQQPQAVQTTPAVKYTDKPSQLSDDDYEHLLKFQSPDQIANNFNYKQGDNYLEKFYTSTMPKPEQQVDPEKLKRAQLYGGISDSISILAQMFAAGKGAHVKERGFDQSATAQVNKRADQLKELYRRENEKYSQGLYNARLKDLSLALQEKESGRRESYSLLQAKQRSDENAAKMEHQRQQAEQKNALDREKFEQQKKHQEATLAEIKRNNKVTEGIRAANAAKSSKSKDDDYLYVPAKEGDKDVVDLAGMKMTRYPATKGQIDDIASRAKLDKDFINSEYYKEAVRNEVGDEESAGQFAIPGQKTTKPRFANSRQLAAYYVQYLQEQKAAGDTNATSALSDMPLFPFKVVSGIDTATGKVVETDKVDAWDDYLIQ